MGLRGGSDTYIDNKGYQRFEDSDKLVHRWTMEKKLGRKLKKKEVVHHKDRDKENNHPSNLWVFGSQKEHDKAHKKDAKRHGKKVSYRGFKDY
jgi:hypothetical protein